MEECNVVINNSIGFIMNIAISDSGRILNKQQTYYNDSIKQLNVYIPMHILNKYNPISLSVELDVGVDGMFPQQLVIVEGVHSETDINKFIFDLSPLYKQYDSKLKLGLAKLYVSFDKKILIESRTFRI